MNWLSAITAALFTGAGAATSMGYIPAKTAGWIAIGGAMIQAFQSSVAKPTPNASLPPTSSTPASTK